ncbi:MAG: zinc-ribbon domain-containing protein [Gemmataceae bacterium]|nr:zinc-ribbon domain-containing protein [Gemmataceae bacterium]
MPEIIPCPDCGRKLQAPDEVLGRDVQCPTCGTTFVAQFGPSNPPVQRAAAPEVVAGPGPERRSARPRSRPQDDYGLDDDPGDERLRGRGRGLLPHRAGTVLTLGILALVGLFLCVPALILGPIAWAMGSNDLAHIRAGRMDPEGESGTASGQTCGIVATVLALIGFVLVFLSSAGGRRGPFFRGW